MTLISESQRLNLSKLHQAFDQIIDECLEDADSQNEFVQMLSDSLYAESEEFEYNPLESEWLVNESNKILG